MRFRSTRLTAGLLALTVGSMVTVGCGSDSNKDAGKPIAPSAPAQSATGATSVSLKTAEGAALKLTDTEGVFTVNDATSLPPMWSPPTESFTSSTRSSSRPTCRPAGALPRRRPEPVSSSTR